MEIRDLETAQHEAAHVVVGAALGLRLARAAIGPWRGDRDVLGFAEFFEVRGDSTAHAIMIAAGIAWDRGLRFKPVHSEIDRKMCMKLVRGRRSLEACVTAAAAVLAGRMGVHARVTRALLEHDLIGADLATLL